MIKIEITEFKKSVHRKYTKDYQSYGFRVGMMFKIDEGEDPIKAYTEAMKVLDKIVSHEDALIFDLMMNGNAPKEDIKNYIVENQEIEEVYPDIPEELDSREDIVYKSMGKCNQDCGYDITWKVKLDGKFPSHLKHDGTILGLGRCPKFNE